MHFMCLLLIFYLFSNFVSQCISYTGADQINGKQNLALAYESFQRLIDKNIILVSETLSQRLAVPDFAEFCTELEEIYERCRNNDKVSFVSLTIACSC